MHKVVVERPRAKSWCVPQFPRPKRPFDDLPKHQSMKAAHKVHKSFTDVLGPLKRWLRRQIGRPWNDAYSEACAVIKPDSVVRAHIKTHLLEMVVRHTFLKDGELWCRNGKWDAVEVPITALVSRWRIAYVNPATGILQAMPQPPRKKPWSPPKPVRWISDEVALKRIDGLWFFCLMRQVPGQGPFTAYDHLAKQVVGRGGLQTKWNRRGYTYWHCHAVRQLSTKELRRYGLTNDAACDGGFPRFRESESPKTAIVRADCPVSRNLQPTIAMPTPTIHRHEDTASFEITSKRRKGFPSETRVGKGVRVVHGDKLLIEKLGRNDPCPCGSSRSFQAVLPALRAA